MSALNSPRMRSESSLSHQSGIDPEVIIENIQEFAFKNLDEQLISVGGKINAMNKRVMKRKCDGLSASRAPLHTPRHIKGSGNVTARSSRFISTTSSSALPSMKSTRTSYVDPYGEIRKKAQDEQNRRLRNYREDLVELFVPMLEKEIEMISSSKLASKRNKETMINMRREIYLRRIRLELEMKKETEWSMKEMIREQLEKERLAKMEAALRAKRQREEVAAAAAGAATPRSPPKDARFPFLGFASGSHKKKSGIHGGLMSARGSLASAPTGTLLQGLDVENPRKRAGTNILQRQGTLRLTGLNENVPRRPSTGGNRGFQPSGAVTDRLKYRSLDE